jgi:hypothetical protein
LFVCLQVFLVTYGGGFARTCPLTGREWAATTLLGALSLPAGVLMRFMPKPFDDDDEEEEEEEVDEGGSYEVQAAVAAAEEAPFQALPKAAAALSASAGKFTAVVTSAQQTHKVHYCFGHKFLYQLL